MESTRSMRLAELVSQALHEEFGSNPSSIKTIARLVDANERAVKNWFNGTNGPNGEFLIRLCRHSDRVLDVVLFQSGRADLAKVRNLISIREKLHQMLDILEEIEATEADQDCSSRTE